jgi:chaperonin cofactor prefoldin
MSDKVTSTDILELVKTKVNASSEAVKTKLVDRLVNLEVSARIDMVEQALNKVKELKTAFDKIKPDQEIYSEDGTKTLSFTKAKFEEKNKSKEKLAKLETALDAYLSTGESFSKLADAMKQLSQPNPKAEQAKSE